MRREGKGGEKDRMDGKDDLRITLFLTPRTDCKLQFADYSSGDVKQGLTQNGKPA